MKNIKIAIKLSIFSISILIVGLFGLWLAANQQMSKMMKASIVQQLVHSVETQAEIVRAYVDTAEMYLIGYAQAPIMTETLKSPQNTQTTAKLQEYTDTYAAIRNDLENIYVADYGSTVIASHVQGVIGATLREGTALKQLQDAIGQGMYNTGIMTSKATGNQVISMYYPVNDNNGHLLGYVGAAIYAQSLRDTLNELSEKENGSNYLLLDSASGTYIFCADDNLIGTTIENKDILEMIAQIKDPTNKTEYFEFTDNGKRIISAPYYIKERDWVFVELTDRDIAFASHDAITSTIGVLCLVVLIVVSLGVWCCISVLAHSISKEAGIIQDLGTLNFEGRKKLEVYCDRKDEVGMIAEATNVLVNAIYHVIQELKEKSAALQKTAADMSGNSAVTSETIHTAKSAIQDIAAGAGSQATETENASNSVLHIGRQIEDTKVKSSSLYEVAEEISRSSTEALETLQVLVNINEQTKTAVEQINRQTLTTNESVLKIRDAAQLITSIAEETNLLSLNASIEAARAGEFGSGFAVVAGQIKKLAEQSNDSAQYIDEIIGMLLTESTAAVQVMDEVKNIMKVQNDHLYDTKNCFEKVSHCVDVTQKEIADINDSISYMDTARTDVVDVVQNLTAIAEENAAGTQEALALMETIDGMIKNVADVSEQLSQLANAIEEDICIFKI